MSRALRSLVCLSLLCLAAGPATAWAQTSQTINPAGGTDATNGLRFYLANQSQIQIWRMNSGQVYAPATIPPSVWMYNGMYLAQGATVYGPSSDVSDFCIDTAWTPVSQTAVTGSGTAADPWQVSTVVAAGTSGITVTFTYTYVFPDQYADVHVVIDVPETNTQVLKFYHIIDTYLAGGDDGPALVLPATGVPVLVGVQKAGVIEAFISSSTPFDHWYSAHFLDPFTQIDGGADLLDTVDTSADTDNAIGVQWTLGAVTGSRELFYRISFTDSRCDDLGVGVVDTGCRAGAPACDEVTNTCHECTETGDCSGTDLCDLGSHTCELCVDDAAGAGLDTGCTLAAPICDAVSAVNECVLCLDTGVPGSVDTGCSEAAPACSDAGDACYECTENADCLLGFGCDPATHLCESLCGNGVVDAPEECDDAGESAACDADCTWADCGDTTVNLSAGEVCDDGNEDDTDACLSSCVPAGCGDGFTWAGVEDCDDAGESATCDLDCTLADCGDGTTNATAGEACDDANEDDTDACLSSCVPAGCGDGFTWAGVEDCDDAGESATCDADCTAAGCGDGTTNLTAGELCDDANADEHDGCLSSCDLSGCGDGFIWAGVEACDDGDAEAGDGCDSACAVEDGFACEGEPSACAPICGDGLLRGAEGCDDGNTDDDDGCDSTCAVEDGFDCEGEPSVCASTCGDGAVASDEACDDGGTDAGDGCDSTCEVEDGWSCDGEPSSCTPGCGDGLVRGAEECDDGNADAGDGCDATCDVEDGWSCDESEPSACAPGCGDGLIRGAEACDDGNTDDDDGCSASCEVEDGFICDGEPSGCEATCGDGLILGAEACDDGNTDAGDGCSASCEVEDGWLCDDPETECCPDEDYDGICDDDESDLEETGCNCSATGLGSRGEPALAFFVLIGWLALRRRP